MGKISEGLLMLSILYITPTVAAVNEYQLQLKNHLFYPSEINIPAGEKVKLIIQNLDDIPEEFDSFTLNREKVIFPQQKATIFIGPLKPGEYFFFGEYNPNTARGKVIVTVQKGKKSDVN